MLFINIDSLTKLVITITILVAVLKLQVCLVGTIILFYIREQRNLLSILLFSVLLDRKSRFLSFVCFFQTYGTHEPYCYPINNVLFNRVRVVTLFYAFISQSREQYDNYVWSPFYKLFLITQNRLDSLNTSTIIFSITVESVADCRFSLLKT